MLSIEEGFLEEGVGEFAEIPDGMLTECKGGAEERIISLFARDCGGNRNRRVKRVEITMHAIFRTKLEGLIM